MARPSPARKIGQVVALVIMASGITWYIVGGMLQNNKPHGYEGFALIILGGAIFAFLDE